MTKITDKIFLGSEDDNIGLTDAVLNVAYEVDRINSNTRYNKIALIDGAPDQVYAMTAAVLLLDHLVKNYDSVLIHCVAGISRSPTILAIYLAVKKEITLNEALMFIKSKRDIDPSQVLLDQAELVLQYLRR